MKLRTNTTLLAISLFAASGLFLTACGKDDKKEDTTKNEDEDIKALEEQLAALKLLLEDTTNADLITSLNEDIETLQDLIDELTAPKCGDAGGTCENVDSAIMAMKPMLDAVCDHLYDCCTPSEVMFGAGFNVTNADQCKAVVTARAQRGEDIMADDYELDLPLYFDLPHIPSIADGLQRGTLEMDADKIAACAGLVTALECEEAEEEYTCGQQEEDRTCYGSFTTGLRAVGEPCVDNDYDDWTNDCQEGLYCEGGTCSVGAQLGDDCSGDWGCEEEGTYCHPITQVCAALGQAGDACAYNDPTKLVSYNNPVVDRCEYGLVCSVETDTCVASCDIGANCTQDNNCLGEQFCDDNAVDGFLYGEYTNSPVYGYYSQGYVTGLCAADLAAGATCDRDAQCASSYCNDGTCAPIIVIALECSVHADCESDEYCYGGTCATKLADDSYCNQDDGECASGMCIGYQCRATVASGGACYGSNSSMDALLDASRVCPTGEVCTTNNVCTAILPTGGTCDTAGGGDSPDIVCGPGKQCSAAGTCANYVAVGGACDNDGGDTCVDTAFCKPTDPQDIYGAGTCVTLTAPGALCDSSVHPSVEQCADGESCDYDYGVPRCPAVESENDSCPLYYND